MQNVLQLRDVFMGQVKIDLTLTNRLDEGMAEQGVLPPEKIRRLSLKDVLVDTGATTLCLPTHLIEQLGLTPLKEVLTSTAAGYQRTRVYQDAKVTIDDRTGVFQCLELPGGDHPLLGVIPLEELGFEPDLQKHVLRKLPMEPGNTYYMAYGHTLYVSGNNQRDEIEGER